MWGRGIGLSATGLEDRRAAATDAERTGGSAAAEAASECGGPLELRIGERDRTGRPGPPLRGHHNNILGQAPS